MLFNSIEFAVAFIVFFAAYWLLGRRLRLQNLLLLASSYGFYAWWDWRFLGLIILTTLLTYTAGLKGRSRVAAGVSIGVNIGILFVFKYLGFFSENLQRLAGLVGWNLDWFTVDVLLPVGISFYTLQAVGYTIDVYRGKIEPERNLATFALFIAFFPQLLAGPIERARDLMPQLARVRHWRDALGVDGAREFLWGLFKKVAVADPCGLMVDRFYGNPEGDAWHLGAAVILFGVQIYCDFSGYSSMARGLAAMLGVRLSRNFCFPYFASNPADFWRRWHITLMLWLRDYVYRQLGGSRRGARRTACNIAIVFLLSGLWHGAGWNFLVWGAGWALVMIVTRSVRERDMGLLTAFIAVILWIPFRLDGGYLEVTGRCWWVVASGAILYWTGLQVLRKLLRRPVLLWWIAGAGVVALVAWGVRGLAIVLDNLVVVSMVTCLLVEYAAFTAGCRAEVSWPRRRSLRVLSYWGLIMLIIMAQESDRTFIYFQF